MKRDTAGYDFRYEMHCHNNRGSACAKSSPTEKARAYFERGYAGIVVTDHFLKGNTAVDRGLPWEEKMQAYYDAYLEAAEFAKGKDFSVLFGLEHSYGHGKEVLTYGISLEFLLAHPDIEQLSLKDYSALVHEAGGFLSMAHPFRHAPYIDPEVGPQPEYLDGAEIFNAFNRDDENEEAARFAEKYHLLPTSGGDVHESYSRGIGLAGIASKTRISTGEELVKLLRSGDYRVIVNGELV